MDIKTACIKNAFKISYYTTEAKNGEKSKFGNCELICLWNVVLKSSGFNFLWLCPKIKPEKNAFFFLTVITLL